jgi:hypothetical protein
MICVCRQEQLESCQVWIEHVATVERSSVHERERVKLIFHPLAKPADRSSRERERVETTEVVARLRQIIHVATRAMEAETGQGVGRGGGIGPSRLLEGNGVALGIVRSWRACCVWTVAEHRLTFGESMNTVTDVPLEKLVK